MSSRYINCPISALKEFLDMYVRGNSPYNYKEHFMQFMNNPADREVYAFKVEDLKSNPVHALHKLFQFLDIQLWLPETTLIEMANECQLESEVATWDMFANLLAVKELSSFMDENVRRCFSKDLKINWKIVSSMPIPKAGALVR